MSKQLLKSLFGVQLQCILPPSTLHLPLFPAGVIRFVSGLISGIASPYLLSLEECYLMLLVLNAQDEMLWGAPVPPAETVWANAKETGFVKRLLSEHWQAWLILVHDCPRSPQTSCLFNA